MGVCVCVLQREGGRERDGECVLEGELGSVFSEMHVEAMGCEGVFC